MRGLIVILFTLTCVLSGSFWLLPTAGESEVAELLQLALSGILSFALFLLVSLAKEHGSCSLTRPNWKLALSGIGAIGGPALLLWLGRRDLNSVMAVATQVSVPVVLAIATARAGNGTELQPRLVPGLIGLAGALLILPVALPESSRGWTGLGWYVAAAGCSGVFSMVCHREMTRVSDAQAWLTVAAANATCFGAFATGWLILTGTYGEVVTALTSAGALTVAIQSLSTAGVIVLLERCAPLALASRFIFIPLLAAMEAFFLMRPTLSTRTCSGALLMLLGGIACLRSDSEEASSTVMSLR